MSNLVIVAIPEETDRVWKISSEKKPHLTLLFLGDGDNPKRDQIAQFLIHAANLCLTRFMLDVDRRGELGEDKADVLFFQDMWDLPQLKEFRHQLLQNETIRTAYDSAEQFPEWQPHLTLGYPKKPAKKDKADDYPITYVSFDRIALWDSNFEGVELVLKRHKYAEAVEMSDLGRSAVEGVLSHYGVKGMRWGVRRDRSATPVGVKTNPTKKRTKAKIKTSGGKNLPAHEDAIKPAIAKQKLKKSGPAALSNQELRELANRMQLEQQVTNLSAQQTGGGKKFVTKMLVNIGQQQAQRIANQKAAEQVDKMLAKEKKK
jgi:2'-5' RNA ligase